MAKPILAFGHQTPCKSMQVQLTSYDSKTSGSTYSIAGGLTEPGELQWPDEPLAAENVIESKALTTVTLAWKEGCSYF